MDIKFEVEQINEEEFNIFDITKTVKVFAGSVKPFIWNKDLGGFKRLEAFDRDGNMVTGGSNDLDRLIKSVKDSYTSQCERVLAIDNKWKEAKEQADELGVSENLFKEYANVRIYLSNIILLKKDRELVKGRINELASFKNTDTFKDVPKIVKDIIDNEFESLSKRIDETIGDIENYTDWINEYTKKEGC